MPRIVGLTGGIATGKSSVSTLVQDYYGDAVALIDADAIARDVLRKGTPAYYLVRWAFPTVVNEGSGEIDRPRLGALIFAPGNEHLRRRLNGITHPFIVARMLMLLFWNAAVRWKPVIVLDTPLLFETRNVLWLCGKRNTIVVYCKPQQQLERLMLRNPDLSRAQATQRIGVQIPIEQKKAMAGFVIDNTGSKKDLERNVRDLFEAIVQVDGRHRAFCGSVVIISVALVAGLVRSCR